MRHIITALRCTDSKTLRFVAPDEQAAELLARALGRLDHTHRIVPSAFDHADVTIRSFSGRLVVIESPYVGDVERNVRYARAAMRDCLLRGELPLASHLLYTQDGILDDLKPDERALGIEAGLAWGALADLTAAYVDLGVSRGMEQGIARAEAEGRPVERRTIAGWA